MDRTEIRPIVTRRDLDQFIAFPFQLYKGNRYWCPPLKSDEFRTLSKEKNPAFEFCEAAYWMAYQNGVPVGRIAGIINHREAEIWQAKLVRFGWFDFIDDPAVSKALITAVTEWGRSKGMTGIHGPLGFNDMDPEGMLIEGFEELSGMAAIYNYPYYPSHMNLLGFQKAADWIQLEIQVPLRIPEKIERMSRIVLAKYPLHLLKVGSSKALHPYAMKMFRMYNETFRHLYGFVPLSEQQIAFYTNQYFSFINPDFVSLALDDRDEVVGFGVTMPSLSRALRRANGSLFPFGFLHLLKALKVNDTVHMYLVGVHPDYQEKGVLALIYHELTKTYIEKGIRIARTHALLEHNSRVVSIWKNYVGRVNIRRRCWVKEIENGKWKMENGKR
ncbi:MAG TPA: N-acetyltransferase [Bacteroidales bacterium]|nr:N-acetyltransferase [Bacteroidales bacterium]